MTGKPEALLLVEFAEEDASQNLPKLKQLDEMMGDLGFSWSGTGKNWGGVSLVTDTRHAGKHRRTAQAPALTS